MSYTRRAAAADPTPQPRYRFDIAAVTPRYPTRSFTGRLRLDVGGVEVELIQIGPAHTDGDIVVHVPSARWR